MIEINGFINVYKPCGMTSNNAVVKVRGLLKAYTGNKKITVAHFYRIFGSKTSEYF